MEKLIKLEPRLLGLLERIKDAVKGRRLTFTQANHLWYGPPGEYGFKHEMNRLVGFMAKDTNPEIADQEAHGIAYRKLYFDTIEPCIQ